MAAAEHAFFEDEVSLCSEGLVPGGSVSSLLQWLGLLSWLQKLLLALMLVGVGFIGAAVSQGLFSGVLGPRLSSGWLETGDSHLRVFLPLPAEVELDRDGERVDLRLPDSSAVIQSRLGAQGQHLALRTPHAIVYAGDALLAAQVDEDRTTVTARSGSVALLDRRGQLHLIKAPQALATGGDETTVAPGPSQLLSFLDLLFPDSAVLAPAKAEQQQDTRRAPRRRRPKPSRRQPAPEAGNLLPRKAVDRASSATQGLMLVAPHTAYHDERPPLVEAPTTPEESTSGFVPWGSPK